MSEHTLGTILAVSGGTLIFWITRDHSAMWLPIFAGVVLLGLGNRIQGRTER